MKITEQFDDIETEDADLEKRKPCRRFAVRTLIEGAHRGRKRQAFYSRGAKQRHQPSLPHFKCLEDA